MSKFQITALGGVDENGKNCYVLEVDNDIFIINTGAKIPVNSNNGVDTIIPDFSWLEANKNKIKAIFITDTKNDSFSALPWLLMNIKGLKIYSSSFNSIIIKDRIEKYNIGHSDYEIIRMVKPMQFANVLVRPIPLAGAMPGLLGYDFEVDKGHILFMFNYIIGDLGIYGRTDLDLIKRIIANKPLLALVIDAGMANYPGYYLDKAKLPLYIDEVFEKAKPNQRIIVGAYDEEMHSMSRILELAKRFNRTVIFYGKTYAQCIDLISKVNSVFEYPEIADYRKISSINNAVVFVTSTVERLYQRFLRITNKDDVYLKLKKTDNVLMIAPPINGIESIAAFTLDEIARITPKIVDVSGSEYHLHRPHNNDIIDVVNALSPSYVIPVMGLYRYLIQAQNSIVERTKLKNNNILIIKNGKVVDFENGVYQPNSNKTRPAADSIIDGFGNGDVSSGVIKERELLSKDGLITVSILFSNKTKKIIDEFNINFLGVVAKSQKNELKTFIRSIIINILRDEQFNSIRDMQDRLRKVIRKKIFKSMDKEPMVIVTFYGI
ncbi:ribonuclease J [Mycoplasma phocimorsus]|uniref:ribonuclease J n=1 Tax=Mycoplasma phocimorsus TaxID=3045839 RepID=UPI0024BFEBDF|nr:ribonuclease J [Mycoplasma phocimorsus]MDJ1646292.1 ribonuclease J [Mycoplasma phocimorsus]MDJ1648575.1 ribonuclease J [Mycoplasma phocimorsus]